MKQGNIQIDCDIEIIPLSRTNSLIAVIPKTVIIEITIYGTVNKFDISVLNPNDLNDN